ncbi:MAG: phosphatase PAP2 family protein [Stigonema ocellatum SAG 48.90 = DSM 106950]|nr:phosphatase PAP2 family protein [Stigonema ocellatum SAG 48.90 = DSM 106950]
MMKQLIFLVILTTFPLSVTQAQSDTTRASAAATSAVFQPSAYIVPVGLMTAGLITQGAISRHVQSEVVGRYPGFSSHVDDVGQFVPTLAVLGLGALGIKGKHAFGDQVVLTILSHGVAQAITQGLKYTVAYPRPDGVGNESFPSGHTSFAFTGAALLAQEYGERSGWYSVAGYGMATTVGALRVMKNRHWLADVLFSAGVGIGSTELVYQLYPWLRRVVFHKKNMALVPIYTGSSTGVCMMAVF